jgi:prepilin peptidase CpaA
MFDNQPIWGIAMLNSGLSLTFLGLSFTSGVLLVHASLHDIFARTIPNWLAIALTVFGAFARIIDGHLITGLWTAIAVFAISAFCWRRGWMGGGDVKLLGATVLAVPPSSVPTLIFVMGMAGGLLSLCYLVARRCVHAPSATRPRSLVARALRVERWRIRRGGPLPYACAIAAGGLFVLL